jgi:predicted SAM-dependent methyltransferase
VLFRSARAFAKDNFYVDLEPLDNLLAIDSDSKDVITMWHVLEHVYHLKRDIGQITRVLKQDGALFIAVPNMNSYDAKVYKEYWAAYDVPRHLYHFQEDTIKQLFSQFNMVCIDVLPMKFDAYYVSMLSEKYKGGSILRAFFNGWLSNMKSESNGYSSQIYVFKKK